MYTYIVSCMQVIFCESSAKRGRAHSRASNQKNWDKQKASGQLCRLGRPEARKRLRLEVELHGELNLPRSHDRRLRHVGLPCDASRLVDAAECSR